MLQISNSHDWPLCAYLMRYDADIQSLLRSCREWYLCKMSSTSNEKQFLVIVRTPNTHQRKSGLIKKCVKKKRENTNINESRHLVTARSDRNNHLYKPTLTYCWQAFNNDLEEFLSRDMFLKHNSSRDFHTRKHDMQVLLFKFRSHKCSKIALIP